jgi:hypothetical protein
LLRKAVPALVWITGHPHIKDKNKAGTLAKEAIKLPKITICHSITDQK